MSIPSIRELRRMTGCTQVELSNRTGISRLRLCLAETGQLRLKPEEKKKLLGVLLRQVVRSSNELQRVRGALEGQDLSEIAGEPSEAETTASAS
jgi:transcriptional regulator with XRE-family HTH domain